MNYELDLQLYKRDGVHGGYFVNATLTFDRHILKESYDLSIYVDDIPSAERKVEWMRGIIEKNVERIFRDTLNEAGTFYDWHQVIYRD